MTKAPYLKKGEKMFNEWVLVQGHWFRVIEKSYKDLFVQGKKRFGWIRKVWVDGWKIA
jgi:hypothetical protein